MAFTPSGAMYDSIHAMRLTIAASAEFQTLTGSANADEAFTRTIYARQRDLKRGKAELYYPRPRAVIAIDEGLEIADAGVGCFQIILPIFVRLEMAAPETYDGTPIKGDFEAEEHWFQTTWWKIAQEMTALMRGSNGTYIASDTPFVVKERPDWYTPENDAIDEDHYAVGLTWAATGAI